MSNCFHLTVSVLRDPHPVSGRNLLQNFQEGVKEGRTDRCRQGLPCEMACFISQSEQAWEKEPQGALTPKLQKFPLANIAIRVLETKRLAGRSYTSGSTSLFIQ